MAVWYRGIVWAKLGSAFQRDISSGVTWNWTPLIEETKLGTEEQSGNSIPKLVIPTLKFPRRPASASRGEKLAGKTANVSPDLRVRRRGRGWGGAGAACRGTPFERAYPRIIMRQNSSRRIFKQE